LILGEKSQRGDPVMMTHSRHYARARQDMKTRFAASLIFAAFLLTTLGWTGEAWGQAKLARVGLLTFSSVTDDPWWEQWAGFFRRNLADRGWIEGKTVSFEYRSAHSDPSQFAEAAVALVGLEVDVIWAASAPSLRAAYAATRTIPIVAGDYTTDPIAEGYIESYARPGGNVTGVFLDAPEFAGKWFELLKAMVPDLSRVSVLWDPGPGANHLEAVRSVASALDIKLQVLEVGKPGDIDRAFDALRGPPQAVIILPSPMIYEQSARFAKLALKHRLPATSFAREFAIAGGAIAYGPEEMSVNESFAVLVAKILGGSDPAELPIERPTKIKLVVNLKTAKALGITIPQSIMLRADEVIR
jgi:putative ABC transport system substrate-binding protein